MDIFWGGRYSGGCSFKMREEQVFLIHSKGGKDTRITNIDHKNMLTSQDPKEHDFTFV